MNVMKFSLDHKLILLSFLIAMIYALINKPFNKEAIKTVRKRYITYMCVQPIQTPSQAKWENVM